MQRVSGEGFLLNIYGGHTLRIGWTIELLLLFIHLLIMSVLLIHFIYFFVDLNFLYL